MRHLASGVCVITTASSDINRCGLTATAVCSVSADPPTLLVCVNSASGTCAAIRSAGHFAVNLLSVENREIANRFASPVPPEERFNRGIWGTLATGSPVLESAVAVFDCNLSRVVEVATHSILMGAIQATRFREPHVRPLLHAHAAFATVVPVGVLGSRPGEQIHSELQFLEDCLHWGLM
jgi:flavin reductase (DIM6/NTAB) family NADH-FMN oxidoreductase RutF